MVTKTATGNTWSNAAHWSPSGVPANGDAVIIPSEIDMTLDVDQSGFANGLLSLQIDGILRFKVDTITALKMNGNVTGEGSLYVGNSESDPIQRPPSGTESRCQLIFNSTATINVPTIRMYGWYPSLEWTQLDADAELNATTIILKEDLGLQAGDKLVIGSGNEFGQILESNKGIYSVQSYDANTKTVTLTVGLQTARLKDDYVMIDNCPIKISRTSGNGALINSTNVFNGFVFIGVNFATGYFFQPSNYGTKGQQFSTNFIIKHCVSNGRTVFNALKNPIFENCRITVNGFAFCATSINPIINNCISINSQFEYGTINGNVKNSIIQNAGAVGPANYFNCKFLNLHDVIGNYNPSIIKDSIIKTDSTFRTTEYLCLTGYGLLKWSNCIFKSGSKIFARLDNILQDCVFEENVTVLKDSFDGLLNRTIQSFNHNQIEGNYLAWMNGGKIETENNKLKFICESNDYPVFRDYPVLAPSNRTIKFLIGLTKDTSGIVTKLQIIDPANDPLIDTTATPLAESIATNTTEAQQIGVAYKSTTPKQIILRILCQNSSGNVIIDTTRIDQSLAKKITSLN